MDFFAQQDHARRKTKKLFVYFALAVISMIVMIYGLATMANSPGCHSVTVACWA